MTNVTVRADSTARRVARRVVLLGGLAGLAGCASPTLEEASLLPRYGVKVPPGRTTRPATAPAFLGTARVTRDAGWDELRRGRLDRAMQDFNAAWRIDPSDAGTLWGMAAVETRRAERLGEPPTQAGLELLDEACRLYDDAVAQGTAPAALRLEAAGARVRRGQFRQALRNDGAANDFGVAERYLRDAGRDDASPALWRAWATLERARGNPAAAQAYERRAVTTPATTPATSPGA